MTMKKISKLLWIVLPVLCAAVFIIWILFPYTNPIAITLASPRVSSSAQPHSGSPISNKAELTPDTVQAVVRTLTRQENYSRNYTVNLYWSGGSLTSNINLTVDGDNMTVNDVTYSRGGVKLAEQDTIARIPTYEDILELERDDILAAAYIEYEGNPYIYVRFNGLMYVHEYYISTDSGLLDIANKYDGEALVYSMDATR
jgi:hypothetical protein